MEQALGYLRTSSLANVGDDKDSDKRQRAAIEAAAARQGFEIVGWFYDPGVSGDMAVADRPAFSAMLDRIENDGVRTVIVESADRFARKMLTAETGILLLIARGVTLLTASGDNLTDTDDDMRIAFRHIAVAFSQMEKNRLVKKLRGARDRKSAALGRRIEGVKLDPKQVAAARRLSEGRSLRATAAAMASEGILTSAGTVLSAAHVARLLRP